jgi:hypothetical protein
MQKFIRPVHHISRQARTMSNTAQSDLSYKAVVLGATGEVGKNVIRHLLASTKCKGVTVFVRKQLPETNEKLTQHIINMDNMKEDVERLGGEELLRDHELAFSAMGVGQPSKVSREDYYKVDYEYVKTFTEICKQSGHIKHMTSLGSVSANTNSWTYYFQVKGKLEEAIKESDFKLGCGLFRPSLLATDQSRYGWTDSVYQTIFPYISTVLPSKLHEIHVGQLANAMVLHAERKLLLSKLQENYKGANDMLWYEDFMQEIDHPDTTKPIPESK